MCLRRPDLIKTLATIETKATKDERGKERGERERVRGKPDRKDRSIDIAIISDEENRITGPAEGS